jgi:3-hydroxybutyryl-CoA dehydrogenase
LIPGSNLHCLKNGYSYDYSENAVLPEADKNQAAGNRIFRRILAMLINEAADTLYHGIASRNDIDMAMTKGVNYPKGLLKWADELGIDTVMAELRELQDLYEEDRYRVCPLLKQYSLKKKRFYDAD